MRVRLSMLVIIILLMIKTNAQEKDVYYPKVGEKIKDHSFTDLVNYPKKAFKVSDYRGQWLVLDFWSKSCGGCIASFPKINNLHYQFEGKAKIVMVGMYDQKTDKNGIYIKNLFKERAKKYKLEFSNAYDSTVLDEYDIYGIPAIFVINPEGILVAKAGKMDSVTLAELIAGKSPNYEPRYSGHEKRPTSSFENNLPILTSGKKANGGIDTAFIGRSLLARWQVGMPEMYLTGLQAGNSNNVFNAIGFDLPELYRFAYTGLVGWGFGDSLYGKISPRVILEIRDTSLFQSNNGRRNSMNTYAYQRNYGSKNVEEPFLRKKLLEDLNTFLAYQSKLEDRDVDVLNLVVKNPKLVSRLKSKGGERQTRLLPDRPGSMLVNLPFNEFLRYSRINGSLRSTYPSADKIPVIIDATGIDFNIDMVFEGDPTDWPQVIEVLNKHGLDLVKGKTKMKCIVISDADDVQPRTK